MANQSARVGITPFGTASTNTTRMMPSTRLLLMVDWVPRAEVRWKSPNAPRTGPMSVPRPPTITQMMVSAAL